MAIRKISSTLSSFWRGLQNPQWVFYLLLYFMVLLIVGTVAQKYIGLFPATHLFFNSFIVWYGILPLPAGATILALLFINLLAHFLGKSRWTLHHMGTTLAHLSILVLLIGGGLTLGMKKEGFLILRKNDTTQEIYAYDYKGAADIKTDKNEILLPQVKWLLPFKLSLEDFSENYYQGTDIAQSFSSALLVVDEQKSWPVLVSMNNPYRYKGYTFYQSSVLTLPNQEKASVLAVVENPGWLFPYVATFLLFIGLALHIGMRRHDKK